MEMYIGIAIAVLIFGVGAWVLFAPRSSKKKVTQAPIEPVTPTGPYDLNNSAQTPTPEQNAAGEFETVGDNGEADAGQEAEASYEKLVADADVAYRRLEFDDAIGHLDEALELAREKFGRDSEVVAQLLLKRGQAYQARDEDSDEEDTDAPDYPRALAIISIKHGAYSDNVLPVLRKLIAFYDQTGRHHDADTLAHRYARIQAALESQQNPTDVTAAAINPAEQPALDADQDRHDPTVPSADTADESAIHDAVARGDGHAIAFEYDDAIAAYEEALGTARELLGHSSEKCAEIMLKIGMTRQNRDDGDEDADDPGHNFRCALAYLEDKYGPTHPKLSNALTLLAVIYDEQGKHSAAEGMLRRLELLR